MSASENAVAVAEPLKQPLTSPEKLGAWLERLPYANPLAALDLLAHQLSLLGTTELKASRQLELLDAVAGAYFRMYGFISPDGQRAGSIRFDAERFRLLEKATRVTTYLADGFETVADGLSQGYRLLPTRGRLLRHALQRAFLFLALTQLQIYGRYRTPGTRLKQRLFALYLRALENKAAQAAPKDAAGRPELGLSPTELKLRLILLSAVDPHRLGPNEVWHLFDLLGAYANCVRFLKTRPVDPAPTCLVVDPRDRRRIMSLTSLEGTRIPEGTWFLDFGLVVQKLEHDLRKMRRRDDGEVGVLHSQSLEARLLSQTLGAISGLVGRAGDREASDELVRVALGVPSCHYALGGTCLDELRPRRPAPASFDVAEDLQEDTLKMIDPRSGATIDGKITWERRRPREGALGDMSSRGAPDEENPEDIDLHVRVDDWLATDVARRGLGLRSTRTTRPGALAVGELAGIRLGTRAGSVGLVRWLSIDETGNCRIGVEYLEGEPAAVTLFQRDEKGQLGPAKPGVVLLPSRTDRRPSLLTSPISGISLSLRDFRVKVADTGQSLDLRALEVLEQTQFMARLSVDIVGRGAQT